MASDKSRRPVGRPPIGEANDEVVRLRLKASTVAAVRDAAARDRRTMTDWIRVTIEDVVEKLRVK